VKKEDEGWISETILIALTPVVLTLFCFAYEIGRFHFYGVTWDLISVDFTTIVAASVGLLLFAKKKIIAVVASGLGRVWAKWCALFAPPIFAFIDGHLYSGELETALYVSGAVTVITVLIMCWKREWPTHPWLGALDATFMVANNGGESGEKKDKENLLSDEHIRALQGVVFVAIFVFACGYWKMRTETVLDVVESNQSQIVIDISDRRIVCVVYDETARKLSSDVIIYNLPLKTVDSLTLTKRDFGSPLVRSDKAQEEARKWVELKSWLTLFD
jgi:hypothetical protein